MMHRSGATAVLHLTKDRPRATPSSPGLISATETKGSTGVAPSLPQLPLVFRVALRECPPCYFKLVATRPATQLKRTPRTRQPAADGSRRLFRRTAGLSLQAFRTCFHHAEPGAQALETTDEMHVAAFPKFIVFSLANHPSNFTDRSMAPEIFPLSFTCPSPGKLPRFLPRAWGNSRKISMEAQIISDDDRFLDEKLRLLQVAHIPVF